MLNFLSLNWRKNKMSDVEIKVENIVASATLFDSKERKLDLPKVAPALENVEYNLEQFPGLVFKLKEPKTAALIFGSGKLVCTGAKCIEDSKTAIKMTVDKIRELDSEIPEEYDLDKNYENICVIIDLMNMWW